MPESELSPLLSLLHRLTVVFLSRDSAMPESKLSPLLSLLHRLTVVFLSRDSAMPESELSPLLSLLHRFRDFRVTFSRIPEVLTDEPHFFRCEKLSFLRRTAGSDSLA